MFLLPNILICALLILLVIIRQVTYSHTLSIMNRTTIHQKGIHSPLMDGGAFFGEDSVRRFYDGRLSVYSSELLPPDSR